MVQTYGTLALSALPYKSVCALSKLDKDLKRSRIANKILVTKKFMVKPSAY